MNKIIRLEQPPNANVNIVASSSKGRMKLYAHLGHHMPEGVADPFSLPLHRAFSVFIFNPAHGMKMLLQQRAHHKITFPSLWSNSCCSHPLQSDQTMISAMQRKLHDELGIPPDFVRISHQDWLFLRPLWCRFVKVILFFWGKWAMPPYQHPIRLGESTRVRKTKKDRVCLPILVDYIYAVVKDIPNFQINPEEVAETKYVSSEELKELFENNPDGYTPWFRAMCKDMFMEDNLYHLWHRLGGRSRASIKPIKDIQWYTCPL